MVITVGKAIGMIGFKREETVSATVQPSWNCHTDERQKATIQIRIGPGEF